MRASFVALAGTIAFVFGVILAGLLGPLGLFFMALGGFTVPASVAIGLFNWWNGRTDG